jgi:hypothetical protein
MNIYYYIAENNPDACLNFCNNYGYAHRQINTIDELVICIQEVIADEGEPAFKDLLKLHPDKGVIMETFSAQPLMVGYDGSLTSQPSFVTQHKKQPCPCECDGKKYNASGSTDASVSSNQTGLFIVAAALLLSVAIITRSQK